MQDRLRSRDDREKIARSVAISIWILVEKSGSDGDNRRVTSDHR